MDKTSLNILGIAVFFVSLPLLILFLADVRVKQLADACAERVLEERQKCSCEE